jgi:peptidoglycan hydrolase-like protein with peptidoglycan-binding domain
MNKEKIISLSIFLAIAFFGSIGTTRAQMMMGWRGEEISNLQKILKEFPEIYPEGYVTGYFGPLTQSAVKRLQAKCNLPETGIVDEATLKCIFPRVKIQVLSPNGGEILDRNQIHTIRWKVETEPSIEPFLREKPIWKKTSIDLLRKVPVYCIPEPCPSQSVFVKHIATVDLFDTVYSWKTTPDIPNGSDYVIRISTGLRILPLMEGKTELKIPSSVPPYWEWTADESDSTFTITGEAQQKESLAEIINTLNEISKNLEKVLNELKRVIELLERVR